MNICLVLNQMTFNVYSQVINHCGEDAYFHYDLNTHILCGVADGHGGHRAANLCKNDIRDLMKTRMRIDETPVDMFTSVYNELHVRCCRLPCKSGCTLTTVLVDKNSGKYVCANVGDSHALHVKTGTHFWITVSHRLQDNPNERQRLKEYLSTPTERPNSSLRLYPGGLAVSRSIGDADCQHVSCEPNIYVDELAENDALVICTDGVWDIVQPSKIVTVVRILIIRVCMPFGFEKKCSGTRPF